MPYKGKHLQKEKALKSVVEEITSCLFMHIIGHWMALKKAFETKGELKLKQETAFITDLFLECEIIF